jgi:hypothetical protein
MQTQPGSGPPRGAGEGLSTGARLRASRLSGPGAVVAGRALVEGVALGGR